jgi:hypothetical protein
MYVLACISWRQFKVSTKILSSWRFQRGKFSEQKERKAGIKRL